MTSLYSSMNENAVHKIPESLAAMKMAEDTSSYKGIERVLSTTVALLSQAQSELDASRLQVENLKKQLV